MSKTIILSVFRMDPTDYYLENIITHNRKGLLRSPFDTPRDDDVLLGRGKCFQFRKGNVRFRDRINSQCQSYEEASKSQKASMLHKMYHDTLSVGRFLKYDSGGDNFVEATKEEVMRKISQAIQYQKRTRIPENERRKTPKSANGKESLSSGICTGKINQRNPYDYGLFPGDESKHRAERFDFFKEILRDREHGGHAAKVGNSRDIQRTGHVSTAQAVLPSTACVHVNWLSKPSVYSPQKHRSNTAPSKHTFSSNFDTLVSDAIDAVLGKRQTETLPFHEAVGDGIQNGGHG